MKKKIPIGISLPEDLVSYIDTKRGDVFRSKYLLRILETINFESSKNQGVEVNQDSLDLNGIGAPHGQTNPSVHNGIDPI